MPPTLNANNQANNNGTAKARGPAARAMAANMVNRNRQQPPSNMNMNRARAGFANRAVGARAILNNNNPTTLPVVEQPVGVPVGVPVAAPVVPAVPYGTPIPASPAQLANIVGPIEANCLVRAMPQYVLQEINHVVETPVNYVTTYTTTVTVPVTTISQTDVTINAPMQIPLNSACPPVAVAAPLPVVPPCGSCYDGACGVGGFGALGGCGGPGAYFPGAGFYPIETNAILAPQMGPFGYGYAGLI